MPNTNLSEDDEDQAAIDEQQAPSSPEFVTPQQWGPGLMPQPQQLNIPSDQPPQAAPAPGPVTPPQDFSQTHGFTYMGAATPPPGTVLPPERMAGDIGPNAAAYARYRATLPPPSAADQLQSSIDQATRGLPYQQAQQAAVMATRHFGQTQFIKEQERGVPIGESLARWGHLINYTANGGGGSTVPTAIRAMQPQYRTVNPGSGLVQINPGGNVKQVIAPQTGDKMSTKDQIDYREALREKRDAMNALPPDQDRVATAQATIDKISQGQSDAQTAAPDMTQTGTSKGFKEGQRVRNPKTGKTGTYRNGRIIPD